MQTKSIGKFSLLGLVLLAASAVTAAFVPAKPVVEGIDNGTLRAQSGVGVDANIPVISCVPDNDLAFTCNITEGTITTAGSQLLSTVNDQQTRNNTSNSGAGYASSILEEV